MDELGDSPEIASDLPGLPYGWVKVISLRSDTKGLWFDTNENT